MYGARYKEWTQRLHAVAEDASAMKHIRVRISYNYIIMYVIIYIIYLYRYLNIYIICIIISISLY
jgi:hypothetical protein